MRNPKTFVNVLTSEYRWTAICRGAVVHGITNYGLSATLGVTVGARVARNSYGVTFDAEFDPQKHRKCDKFWSEDSQAWYATDQMEWFLREVGNLPFLRKMTF